MSVFSDFHITKQEVIASISIIAIMLLLGFLFGGMISDYEMDKNEIYNKAVKIESTDLFKYGMETNIGNAFVYGDMKATVPVTYSDIGGEYMYIERVKEKYTKHTRTVTYTTGTGKNRKTATRVETYWTWDKVGKEEKMCESILFRGIEFPSSKFDIPSSNYITTIKETNYVRYKYYGVESELVGTIFTVLKNNTISDKSDFYENMDITQTVDSLEQNIGEILFWIFWIILTAACVFGFFYFENRWLE